MEGHVIDLDARAGTLGLSLGLGLVVEQQFIIETKLRGEARAGGGVAGRVTW